jgi:hypothetical protein
MSAMPNVRLTPGHPIYVRYFQKDIINGLYPAIVIHHDDEGLLTWTPPGSRHWFPNMPDGRVLRQTPLPEWFGTEKPWGPLALRQAALSWRPTGEPYALQLHFDSEDGKLTHYYANLEEPAIAWRDEQGGEWADSEDWDLDVWIEPDLSWRLKDEDDVTHRLRWPDLYWVDPQRAYAAADRVIARVAKRQFPFDGTWPSLLDSLSRASPAGPQWTPIEDSAMPDGWDRPRHY